MNEQNSEKRALVPRLRFPEFQEAGEWGNEFGDKVFDQIINKDHNSDLPILAITQEHGAIPRNLIDYHVSVAESSIEGYKVVEVGDFIISLRTFQGGIEYSKYRGICSPAYVILRLRPGHSADYLRQYLKTDRFIGQLNKNIEGLRDGKMISYKQFSELNLYLPSHTEQQKIADCLSSLDELVAAEIKKMNALEVYKKGLMQQLFPREIDTVPRLRFPEFRDAIEWEIKALSTFSENLDNRRVPITSSDRIKGSVPYYGASGIVDYVQDFIFNEELLCISEDGANLVARTTPIAFPISGNTWVNNHAHVLRFENSHTQKLVEDYLNSIPLDDFITGMAQPKLNRAMLDIIPVPVPQNENEKKSIASCFFSLDTLINNQNLKIEALKRGKKGLVQQLFPALGVEL